MKVSWQNWSDLFSRKHDAVHAGQQVMNSVRDRDRVLAHIPLRSHFLRNAQHSPWVLSSRVYLPRACLFRIWFIVIPYQGGHQVVSWPFCQMHLMQPLSCNYSSRYCIKALFNSLLPEPSLTVCCQGIFLSFDWHQCWLFGQTSIVILLNEDISSSWRSKYSNSKHRRS